MELRVLGDIRLHANGMPVPLGSGRERELLVHLALAGNTSLALPELAQRLWDSPSSTFRSTLHTYITRLRRRLEESGVDRELLSHNEGGYLLRLPAGSLDWQRLLLARSRASAFKQAGDHASARSALEEAVRLRRGTPLAGLSGRWMARMRLSMERAYQETLGEWASLALDLGDAAPVVRVLDDALVHYPLNEALHLHALRGLRELGRTADALVLYQQLKERLTEELGVDPSRELQQEFRTLLRHTAAPPADKDPTPLRDGPLAPSAPDNLGRDLTLFRHREAEQLLLNTSLREQSPSSPRTWVISGMAGIGKSALAIRVAHQVKGDYPDARLYLDLRGNHERLEPLTPGEAVTELLQLLRIPASRIPESFTGQVALWREHTRSRRVLLVLDDAAGAEQVSGLLPSGEKCATMITSRFQLPELDEADHLPLGLPSVDECADMFSTASGRVIEHPDERALLEELVARCGRLPLVLRLMATMLRLHPSWSLDGLLARFPSSERSGVGAFRFGHVDLSRVFDLALRAVDPPAREAFSRLGLHPTRDIGAPVAVALIGGGAQQAHRALDALVGACLLEEHEPGRYRFHTLLKNHAFHRAHETLSAEELRRTHDRMHDTYLSLCRAADEVLHPHRPGHGLRGPAPQAAKQDPVLAQRWMRTELPRVLTVIREAYERGQEGVAAELSHAVAEYLDLHGPWQPALLLHERAVAYVREHGNAREAARAHYDLARALWRCGELDRAHEHARAADGLWARMDEPLGRVWCVALQGLFHYVSGDYDRSRSFLERALEDFKAHGNRAGILFALRHRGLCHFTVSSFHEAVADFSDAISVLERSPDPRSLSGIQVNLAGAFQQLGYHRQAWSLCEAALASAQENGDDRQEAIVWANMGELALHRQRPARAVECLSRALDLMERFPDPWAAPMVLSNTGAAYAMNGEPGQARVYFRRSLEMRGSAPPAAVFDACLGLALIELEADAPRAAVELLEDGLAVASRYGLRRESAKAHHLLGQQLHILGRSRQGRTHLEAAASLYDELAAPEASLIQLLLDTTAPPES